LRPLSASLLLGAAALGALTGGGACIVYTGSCQASDGGALVSSLGVEADPTTARASGDQVELTLHLTADIPCLRGITHAYVSSSEGKVGGVGAGGAAVVALSPVGDTQGDGRLEGFVQLVAPPGATVHVVVQIDAFSQLIAVDVPVVEKDGG